EKRLLSSEDLLSFAPHLGKRNLPAIMETPGDMAENLQEREILYKFLFEMKQDMNDMKNLIIELVRKNNLAMPEPGTYRGLSTTTSTPYPKMPQPDRPGFPTPSTKGKDPGKPILLDTNHNQYQETEIVEESLKLEDMEKELISKALKKHNNRRKEAAEDLGISERTLYRKIKEYQLQ
ncbi:MAG TPA: sigma-54-dependent Fis family transcriptional regulator, partial [Bacteroidetes bacterium]|nr:sigma-54-dependent Fis family transcriptional regulator [Bacteroidota bacterium]